MRVGRLTSDIVLFSVVAFKTLYISQGSVATHLRCCGIFSDSIIKFSPDSDSEIILKIGWYLVKLRRTKMVPIFGPPCMETGSWRQEAKRAVL